MPKSAQDYLKEANDHIQTITQEDLKKLEKNDIVLVDVRSKEAFEKGHIQGAVHVERGMLEFYTDPSHALHKPELAQDKTYVVYCEVGGQGTLATKVMQDMGVENVKNLVGGYQAWQA